MFSNRNQNKSSEWNKIKDYNRIITFKGIINNIVTLHDSVKYTACN